MKPEQAHYRSLLEEQQSLSKLAVACLLEDIILLESMGGVKQKRRKKMSLADKIPVDDGANCVFALKAQALVKTLEPVVEALSGSENLALHVIAAMTPERCESLAYGVEAEMVEKVAGKPALDRLRAALTSLCYTPGAKNAVNDPYFREQFGYAKGYSQCLTA